MGEFQGALRGVPKFKTITRTHLTEEQGEWIGEKILAGLSCAEISRMFFREFGRDLSDTAVRKRKRVMGL